MVVDVAHPLERIGYKKYLPGKAIDCKLEVRPVALYGDAVNGPALFDQHFQPLL